MTPVPHSPRVPRSVPSLGSSLSRHAGASLFLAILTAPLGAQTRTFDYTGGLQTYVAPPGATILHITADGGSGGSTTGGTGGAGGRVEASFHVAPGTRLVLLVGGRGEDSTNDFGGGGGGATYVAIGSNYNDLHTPLVLAGGGGGGTFSSQPGMGPGGAGGVLFNVPSSTPPALGAGGGSVFGNGPAGFFGFGGGQAALHGAAGGATHGMASGGAGGYGSGGGAGGREGCGGGGYNGGHGAYATVNATGGSSHVLSSALAFENTPGANPNAHGRIVLSWDCVETFEYSGGRQEFVIPIGVTSITATATGARGGGPAPVGGRGGLVQGTFDVTPGAELQILVGGRGTDGGLLTGGGGGGGSFVAIGNGYNAFANPLLVAGGGGGGSGAGGGWNTTSGAGGSGPSGAGLGGSGHAGSGGGGIHRNGGSTAFANGGLAAVLGARGGTSRNTGGNGGYGGGGAADGNQGGGGGGGYTGGDGGGWEGQGTTTRWFAATGGSSFVHPSARGAVSTPGANTSDNGRVTIQLHHAAASVRVTPNSVGCGSTPLTFRPNPGSAPRFGSTFLGRITNVPANTLATLTSLGISTSSYRGIPLPFDLGLLGAPGCRLYNDMLFGTNVVSPPWPGADFRNARLPIPNDPLAAGVVLYSQAWAIVPGANALGLLTSENLELTVGY